MDDLLRDFLAETEENLATLDVELVRLEQTPDDPGLISSIFRAVHTVKGTCGFLGLSRLERVAHAAENVLGRFRDRDLPVTPAAVSLILASLDRIKSIVAGLAAAGEEPAGDDGALIARLDAAYRGEPIVAAPAAEVAIAPALAESPQAAAEPLPSAAVPTIAVPSVTAAPETQVAKAPAAAGATPLTPMADAAEPAEAGAVASGTIRVSIELLEQLMTTASELVLTRNQLLQVARQQKDSAFQAPLARLSQVVTELQEGVMKTRMQPIGNAWAKLPRIIRDLSHELGKKIELDMRGAETELDRQVLELIKDPLTHMVRNSADHGIETPAQRAAAGKPETGRIRLAAHHQGGHIIIEISDDGRGLNLERIRQKALANGLATEAELASLTERQIVQFIFHPGFSTAEKVTSVSGRGVGMDVVKTNIDRIGGTISVDTTAGRGSRFTIKIPLTLAIVSALIVAVGDQRFAVPQLSVIELVRASQGGKSRVERIKGAPFLRLRDRLLPLVDLAQLLRLGTETTRDPYVVVTQVGGATFGMVVDRVFDTEEIVVKPAAPILRQITAFAGNTILGDGSVVMILDPNGIARSVGVSETDTRVDRVASEAAAREEADRTSLLLFRAVGGLRAVPLALIARLEEIEADKIEHSDGRRLIQYRGGLMPLVELDPDTPVTLQARQPLLVFQEGDRAAGLLVEQIVDIVEERLELRLAGQKAGIIGTGIIGGRATDIVDVGHVLAQAFQGFWQQSSGPATQRDGARRLLLVDDSPFFRNMLRPLLTSAGYRVTTAADGEEALALWARGERFDVVVSDIDMPRVSGFELAQRLREQGGAAVPLVALSAHTDAASLERGRAAGFDDYVVKGDRVALLHALRQTDPDAVPTLKGAA